MRLGLLNYSNQHFSHTQSDNESIFQKMSAVVCLVGVGARALAPLRSGLCNMNDIMDKKNQSEKEKSEKTIEPQIHIQF